MKIAIIGTTPHGQAIGRLLATSGHEVSVSDPYAPDRAAPAAAGIASDASAETPYQQASVSDVLIFTTRWEDLDQALAAMGPPPETAVIVNATKPLGSSEMSGAEMLSKRLNTHRIVEAFTQTPERGAVVPLCGDDPEAKEIVMDIIRSMGCTPSDLGGLKHAAEIERSVA
jgi:predicted dinucleotide-binding enzyme